MSNSQAVCLACQRPEGKGGVNSHGRCNNIAMRSCPWHIRVHPMGGCESKRFTCPSLALRSPGLGCLRGANHSLHVCQFPGGLEILRKFMYQVDHRSRWHGTEGVGLKSRRIRGERKRERSRGTSCSLALERDI